MEYYIIIFTFLSSISICDTTLLWRIDVNPPAYFFGTVHLPYTYLLPSLSATAKSAFDNSTHFLPEFDMTNFFEFTRFRMCLNARTSSKLNSPPPPPPEILSQRGPQDSILDVYLTLEARRMRKNVTSLESVDMYCEFTKFQAESFNKNFPSNSNKSPYPDVNVNEEMKRSYNCDLDNRGEFFPTSTVTIEDKKLLEFKQHLEEIVDRRNTNMAETIDKLLKGASHNDRLFFAVGCVHLMSPTGLIAKLKENYKYSITRLCTDPPEFRSTLSCRGPSWCDPISGL